MKNVEEYLYYNESQDYGSLKFLSAAYYQRQQRLLVRYVYAAEIESRLPALKKRLEELFIQQVGLPIKYDFVYKKTYNDSLTLQLEIVSFLHKKFGAITAEIKDDNVAINFENNFWKINLFLKKSLIDFLENSKPWQKFKQTLRDKNFYELEFYMNVI